jgi:hypothetical protein
MKCVNLIVQLRDEFIESSLEGLHGSFLLALDVANDVRQLRYLLNALGKVIFVFFLNLELEFSHSIVDLPEEVNAITDVLEILINIGKMSILLNELFNISDWLGQIGDGLAEPFLRLISSLADNLRD